MGQGTKGLRDKGLHDRDAKQYMKQTLSRFTFKGPGGELYQLKKVRKRPQYLIKVLLHFYWKGRPLHRHADKSCLFLRASDASASYPFMLAGS